METRYISLAYMDLFKAFDTVNHDTVFSKTEAKKSHKNKASSSEVVVAVVPESSIGRPLLFDLFINDFIFFLYAIVLSNYSDDNKVYAIGNNNEETERVLAQDFQTVIDWFYENCMILNTGKCNFMCTNNDVG